MTKRIRLTESQLYHLIRRAINEMAEVSNEPYLWCDVSSYDEGDETAYELDQLVDQPEDINLEHYDYTYGDTPDDLYNCLTKNPLGNYVCGDDNYQLRREHTGFYVLYRKMYLDKIKEWLDKEGGLPQCANQDFKDFVDKYCPEYA